MTRLTVVGSGLFGLTIARLAAEQGHMVTLIDKREHLGGNAYSHFDPASGIEVHNYGAHLFHTSNEWVWGWMNRFATFNNYQHRVRTTAHGEVYPLPFNLGLLNQFFHAEYSPMEAKRFLETIVAQDRGLIPAGPPTNLEDKAISLVGEQIYQTFIRDYTRKQWDTDPRDLPASIISRLPVRMNYDDRYFTDTYQGQPAGGYGLMLSDMAAHPNIEIHLNTEWTREEKEYGPVVYTGPLDRFYNYNHGVLGWRTVDFEVTHMSHVDDYLGIGVMNYADADVPFTREIEFKHFHPERQAKGTVVAREFSRIAGKDDEPYYPIGSSEDQNILAAYRGRASTEKDVWFGGRLGTYQYLDMHMAVASAKSLWDNKIHARLYLGKA